MRISAYLSVLTITLRALASKDISPFPEGAIIESVQLPEDIAPVLLNDVLFFLNITKANVTEDQTSKLSKRDAFRFYDSNLGPKYGCIPVVKRDAEPAVHRWRTNVNNCYYYE